MKTKLIKLSQSDRKMRIIVQKAIKEALANTFAQPKPLLSEAEAAIFLKVAKGTLPVWRHKGKGPKFIKFGSAVRYSLSDLKDYVKASTVSPQ